MASNRNAEIAARDYIAGLLREWGYENRISALERSVFIPVSTASRPPVDTEDVVSVVSDLNITEQATWFSATDLGRDTSKSDWNNYLGINVLRGTDSGKVAGRNLVVPTTIESTGNVTVTLYAFVEATGSKQMVVGWNSGALANGTDFVGGSLTDSTSAAVTTDSTTEVYQFICTIARSGLTAGDVLSLQFELQGYKMVGFKITW